jgi:hypothetical protein
MNDNKTPTAPEMPLGVLHPLVSVVTSGMQGKTILFYGPNRTGKTSNIAAMKRVLFLCFENGLNAIPNASYLPIKEWNEFVRYAKALTKGDSAVEARKMYDIIAIDTIDEIGPVCENYICSAAGVASLSDGTHGRLWSQFKKEVNIPLNMLLHNTLGYTVAWVAHVDENITKDAKGNVISREIFPAGDKRVVEKLRNECDIIAYARPSAVSGEPADLLLTGTTEILAGSRFKNVPQVIPAWTWDKLSDAISDSIKAEEKATGTVAQTFEEHVAKATAADQAIEASHLPLQTLKLKLAGLVKAEDAEYAQAAAKWSVDVKTNPSIPQPIARAKYNKIVFDVTGDSGFQAMNATEEQRPLIERIVDLMEA